MSEVKGDYTSKKLLLVNESCLSINDGPYMFIDDDWSLRENLEFFSFK